MEVKKQPLTPRVLKNDTMLTSTPSTSSTSGPFRATELWNDLVSGLRSQMTKRRRVKMKSSERSFTGQAAVDVVLQMLLSDKYNFTNKNLNRDNAIKLCQFMLDSHVLESVSQHRSDHNKANVFEDSGLRLYRFEVEDIDEAGMRNKENSSRIDTSCIPCHELSGPGNDVCSDDSSGFVESNSTTSSKGILGRHVGDLSNLLRRHSTANSLTHSPLSRKDSRRSLADFSCHSALPCPPAVVDEVRREVALTQLLSLIHIPILDSILSYDPAALVRTGNAYSNLAFRRYESIYSIFSDTSRVEDSWWDAGMDCLASVPNNLDIIDTSLSEDTMLTQKLRLYQAIADHYTKLPHPLWPENFSDVQVGVLRLLMELRHDVAVKALQLSIMLLADGLRDELRCLLDFLHQAANDDVVKLSAQCSNHEHVAETFASVLVRNPLLAPHQAGQLLLFLLDHVEEVWRESEEVESSIRLRLAQLQHADTQRKLVLDVTYCHQVSQAEFQQQQLECTEQALVDLINTILDNTAMPLKDKKQKLKQLQKHHPTIFKTHFSDLKW